MISDENLNPTRNLDGAFADLPFPLSFDAALQYTRQHSSLPPASALQSLDGDNLAKVVECANFAGFLPTLWPAAFGASAPAAPASTRACTSPC